MSAEILRFIPCPGLDCEQTDFPTIVFRSAVVDDLTMDHADTPPCEHAAPGDCET